MSCKHQDSCQKNACDKKLFLVSTTHGGETTAIAAGLATMRIFEENNVVEYNQKIGQYFINGVTKILLENKVEDYFTLTGFNWSVGLIIKNREKQPCMYYRRHVFGQTKGRVFLSPKILFEN